MIYTLRDELGTRANARRRIGYVLRLDEEFSNAGLERPSIINEVIGNDHEYPVREPHGSG